MEHTSAAQVPALRCDVPSSPASLHGLRDRETSRLKETVCELEAFGHRGSGSEKERIAAEYAKRHLESCGIETAIQPFRCQSSYGMRILLHLIVGCAGLGLLFWSPAVGLMLSLIALASFLPETSGIPVGLSNLLPGGLSQNVVGIVPAAEVTKRRLVVCAHIDTQQTGWIWNTRALKFFTSTFGILPGPFKAPLILLTLALSLQLLVAVVLSWGFLDGVPIGFLVLTSGIYLVALILVGQWSIGKFVPGANDNATGVACAFALAERWQAEKHNNTELVILISGCEEPGLLGAASWVKQNRSAFSRTPTFFVNLDLVGCRDLHFLRSECALNGWVVPYPNWILRLCHEVAEEMSLDFPNPHTIPTHTDGLAFLARNVPGLTITSSESGTFVPHYHTMSDRSEYVNFETVSLATEFAWRVIERLEFPNCSTESPDSN